MVIKPSSKSKNEPDDKTPSNPKGVNVRRYQSSDLTAVKSLIQGILNREFPNDQPAYPASDLERISVAYGGSKDAFLLAEIDRNLVGTCAVKDEGEGAALLRRLFVHLDYRKEGIGSLLLSAAIAHCRTFGFKQIKIRTSDRMVEALRLCAAKGFKEDDRFELGSVQLVCMTLRI